MRWVFQSLLALSLVQCGGAGAKESAPTPKGSAPAKPAPTPAESEPLEEPSIALGIDDPTKKRLVRKTERIERQAADPLAGQREASEIDAVPELVKLREEAVGKALEVPAESLDHFYAELAPLARKDADGDEPHVVHVLHVGDSFIGQDVFPHAMRRRMQQQFGDAGPGFQLVDIHNRANIHRGIALKSAHFRTCYVRNKCLGAKGRYGYGGHVSNGGPGAMSWSRPRRPEAFVAGKGHVEIWYQRHDRGGTLEVRVGDRRTEIDTRSEVKEDAWARIPLGTEDLEVRLKALGPGRVRGYGVSFETGESGVVWDSTPHTGAFANRVLAQDPAHFQAQIAHRRVDLLVYNFGGNDLRRVAKGNLGRDEMKRELSEAIALYRSGRPQMSCLVVSSTDHAKSAGTPVTPQDMEIAVGAQRDAAMAQGCAFLDAMSVFGGSGNAKSLSRGQHPVVGSDLSHLTALGRELLADVLFRELLRNMPKD